MNNIEREYFIKQKFQSGDWTIKTRKTGFDVLNSSGTVIATGATRHDALKLAVELTQGKDNGIS